VSAVTDNAEVGPAAVDRAATQVLRAIDEACEPDAGFREQVEEALAAVLGLFATEPSLVHPLTSHWVSREAAARQRALRVACAGRLREAAEKATGTEERPPFVEPFLIAGVQFQISSLRRADELERLPTSVPSLRDWILTYYPQA
jgi:hypothetical protein